MTNPENPEYELADRKKDRISPESLSQTEWPDPDSPPEPPAPGTDPRQRERIAREQEHPPTDTADSPYAEDPEEAGSGSTPD